MALSVIKDIRKIYAGLNAEEIRTHAARPLKIGLQAPAEEGYQLLERFLAPGARSAVDICRLNGSYLENFDFVLYDAPGFDVSSRDVSGRDASSRPDAPAVHNSVRFDAADPEGTIREIVRRNPELDLALANSLSHFRKAVSDRLIHRISRENAMFALVTALPNVIPSVIDLPWSVGEFATDTAFLTMNQLRMAMLLAAAHDRPVGYGVQKMEMAAIVGSAFGWRAIARELVGKIPLGGGLIPKAAVAFAGTWVVGLSLEKVNRGGPGLSRDEKRDAYVDALARGREAVRDIAPALTKNRKG